MSTGARVGGVRPPGIPRESWLRRKTIKSEAARRVREVTDNRTNEPTPEQIIEDALRNSYASGSYLARLIVSDLHAHGLLVQEPDKDAVERAAAEKAWIEGHAAGRDYQGDGWNCDGHDPQEDNPYRAEAYRRERGEQ